MADIISSPAEWKLRTVAQPSWFQTVQDTVNGVFGNGTVTYSFAGIVVDGVGYLPITPTVGQVAAQTLSSSTAKSSTTLSTGAITKGVVYKESMSFAWGYVSMSGGSNPTVTFRNGLNVATCAGTGAGAYSAQITFATAAASTYYAVCVNTVDQTGGAAGPAAGNPAIYDILTTGFKVKSTTSGPAAQDFTFVVFAS